MGAGGRDYHNFNVYFRNNPNYRVVAFTATQIPYLEGRVYPPELSGPMYPNGIPIYSEKKLPELIRDFQVNDVFFCYSDVSYQYVMEKSALVNSLGASFHLLGPKDTMLTSNLPVISVVAIRTGSGKSPVSRYIAKIVSQMGFKIGIIRHPMAYGDLLAKRAMKLSNLDDLKKYPLTIEEREDYEPHIIRGFTVYSGVDYQDVLNLAEGDGNDVLIWDGGNNDYPFIKPDLYVTVVDPYRYTHMDTYYPSGINVRLADVIVITKVNTAPQSRVNRAIREVRRRNPRAVIVKVGIKAFIDKDVDLRNKRVLVIEDGPTITHGEMPYGIGYIYAKRKGAIIVDPKKYAVGSIRDMYRRYRHIKEVLPAIGYSESQVKELEEVINHMPVDYVILATPTKLERIIHIDHDVIHVTYEVDDYKEELARIIIKKLQNILIKLER